MFFSRTRQKKGYTLLDIKSTDDLKQFSNSLRLQENGAHSKVNQIFLDLLKALMSFQDLKLSAGDQSELTNLINQIKNGEIIPNNVFRKMAFNSKILQNSIPQAVRNANLAYENHCVGLYRGFGDVLTQYLAMTPKDKNKQQNASWFNNLINSYFYFKNGHAYRGRYREENEMQPFIQLVNRIALIDASGEYLTAIGHELSNKNHHHFNYQNQKEFLDRIYQIFICVEKQYFNVLKQKDDAYKKQLADYYQCDLVWLSHYYDACVHGISIPDDQKPVNIPDQLGKLDHDLAIIKEEIQNNKDEINDQLKKLKKDIHHVAQPLGLYSRLKKKSKLDNQNQQSQDPYASNYVLLSPEQVSGLIPAQKQYARKQKARFENISVGASAWLSFGEGAVAGVTLMTVMAASLAIPTLLIVGAAGMFCNYFLFKSDIYDTLKELFLFKQIKKDGQLVSVRKLWLNKDDEEISVVKKSGVIFSFVASIATGFVYGALSSMSVFKAMTFMLPKIPLITQLGLGNLGFSVIAGGISSCVGVGGVIGLTCIFFVVLSDFIKNDRMKSITTYFYNTYINKPWKEMSGWEIAKHWLLQVPIELFKLSLGIVANVAFTFGTLGAFHKSGIAALEFFTQLNATTLFSTISWVMTYTNAVTSLPFSLKRADQFINRVCPSVKTFATLKFTPPIADKKDLQDNVSDLNTLKKAVGIVTTTINAAAYSFLAGKPTNLISATVVGGTGFISVCSNMPPFTDAIERSEVKAVVVEDKKNLPDDNEKKPSEQNNKWRFLDGGSILGVDLKSAQPEEKYKPLNSPR